MNLSVSRTKHNKNIFLYWINLKLDFENVKISAEKWLNSVAEEHNQQQHSLFTVVYLWLWILCSLLSNKFIKGNLNFVYITCFQFSYMFTIQCSYWLQSCCSCSCLSPCNLFTLYFNSVLYKSVVRHEAWVKSPLCDCVFLFCSVRIIARIWIKFILYILVDSFVNTTFISNNKGVNYAEVFKQTRSSSHTKCIQFLRR